MNAVSRPSTSTTFVEDYAAAAGRLADAVLHTDLRSQVRHCPGWTVQDVVVHLGNVHAWAATIVETGRAAPQQADEPRSSRPRAVSEWYVGKAEDLYQVLRHTAARRPCWTFAPGAGDALFWQRRQLHETTIHLVDLHLAAGRPAEIPAEVAADGVDEVLTVMVPRMHARGRATALRAPLRLTASDTGDTWVLSPAAARTGPERSDLPPQRGPAEGVPPTVLRGAGAVPARDAVTAPAAVLYRLLWQRLGPDDGSVEVRGDRDRVASYLASPLVP